MSNKTSSGAKPMTAAEAQGREMAHGANGPGVTEQLLESGTAKADRQQGKNDERVNIAREKTEAKKK
jgi:hypothetical protein